MSVDIKLVKRVLQDVIAESTRTVFEVDGKPVYEIAHVTINDILSIYVEEARDE